MRSPLELGGESIAAGTRRTVHLPLPYFYTHAPTTMPVHVLHGKRPGPCVLIAAALHGDEINGIEIIRRIGTYKSLSRLKGTLLLLPVVNVFGFVAQSRYLPDRRDLNRSFPGSPKGSMAARLAHVIINEILPHCSHVLDLHTAAIARENLPQIRASLSDAPDLETLARAFGAPVIIDAPLRPGTFRAAADAKNIPMLVYEAGEALRFDEVSIRAGVAGCLNVLASLDMIRPRSRRKEQNTLIAKSTQWVRAPQSGVVRALIPLGARVAEGETLAYISDPFGEHEESLLSSAAGIVIGRTVLPLVHEGEAVFHIARFARPGQAEASIEEFHDAFDPVTDTTESEEPPLI